MSIAKIESLIRKLDVAGDLTAEKVIAQLVKVGKPAVPPLLSAAKNEEERRIQKWSLQALGQIGDKRGAGVLIASLKDERMSVKLHALRGLGKMKLKKSAKSIVPLLKDESGGIRVNALYALMAIGDASVAPALRRALGDEQWYVRQNACVACGLFKDKKARARIATLAKTDERKAVRSAAEEALRRIDRKD
jgi:HEAT repeat protein